MTGKICKQCENGFVEKSYEKNVYIEPGVKHRDVLIVKGEGNCYRKGGNFFNGNIEIIFEEIPHSIFRRSITINEIDYDLDDYDLAIYITISLHESLCGFTREITTIGGATLNIGEIDIIPNNTIKIINNKGMVDRNGNYGDLYVVYQIIYPKSMNEKQKTLISSAFGYSYTNPLKNNVDYVYPKQIKMHDTCKKSNNHKHQSKCAQQ